MVRTRMPGGVGGKAREGLPIPIVRLSTEGTDDTMRQIPDVRFAHWG